MPTTVINIRSYYINMASFPDFNSWKASVDLYRTNGMPAAVIKFVDNPATFVDYNSVNPSSISTFYIDYQQFPAWIDVLHNHNRFRMILYPESKKMILEAHKRSYNFLRSKIATVLPEP